MARLNFPSGNFSRRTPWSYRAETSALHRCPAGIKFILLLMLSAAPFFGFPFAGGAAILILTGAFFSGLKIPELLSGSLPLLIMLLFFVLLRSSNIDSGITINMDNLKNGLYLTGSILICFTAASLFFAVTTITEIRKTFAAIEYFFFRKKGKFSLAFSLMLAFLPRFFECWENTNLAVISRSCNNTLRRVTVVLPVVVEKMIETAAEIAQALESRGYE
jgi:energy-coupling factor transporter transmembrane protein EcfT